MSYGKVHDAFWDSETIDTLSDRAALLALFLLTGEHRNAIGCFRLGTGAISDIPRFGEWGIEGVSKALLEIADTGFIARDQRTGWTLVTKALKHDPISGPKAAIHALGLLDRVPTKSVVYQSLVECLEPQLKPYDEALQGKEGWPIDTPSKGYSKPKRSPSPSPLPEPEPKSSLRSQRAREAAAIETDFATWYDGYPHKVGKGAALKAYKAARKKVDQQTLIDGVEAYVRDKPADFQWCNPATWLNAERWLDIPAFLDRKTNGKLTDDNTDAALAGLHAATVGE